MKQKTRSDIQSSVLKGFLVVGLLSALVHSFANAYEQHRDVSSLNQLAAPELSQAVQNAGKNKVPYLPTSSTRSVQNGRLRSGIALPVYSNSFPPMIAQVRTQNWDQ